jgi:cellulose synthase/poly-beta-1,6-N-acetylglucosamine synthase-like glycosyltransferase
MLISVNSVIFIIFLISFLVTLILFFLSFKKKQALTKHPFVSFIIPAYNSASTIGDTIKSIYSSYASEKLEIFVVNDNSKDNTLDILTKLNKKLKFKIISNKTNLGKAVSVNNVFKKTKGEIIFVIDSDIILRKENVNDILSRLENKQVGASSCRYKPINTGFLARMTELEYGFQTMVQASQNRYSSTNMWGGCIGIKREIFEKSGMFSKNMLSEDMDLTLKVSELGFRVEESSVPVLTHVPSNLLTWIKQKMRWGAGYSQNFLKHIKTFIKHPIALFFIITYVILTFLFLIAAVNNLIFIKNLFLLFDNIFDAGNSLVTSTMIFFKLAQGYKILETIAIYFLFPLFSLPYAIINIENRKELYKILLIFPFAIIYLPLYAIFGFAGFVKGAYKHFTLKEKDRGW